METVEPFTVGYSLCILIPRVRILARILAKCELKKAISEVVFSLLELARWYFLYLHFLASGSLGLLSVVLILDINLLSSFPKCRSLTVTVFVIIQSYAF